MEKMMPAATPARNKQMFPPARRVLSMLASFLRCLLEPISKIAWHRGIRASRGYFPLRGAKLRLERPEGIPSPRFAPLAGKSLATGLSLFSSWVLVAGHVLDCLTVTIHRGGERSSARAGICDEYPCACRQFASEAEGEGFAESLLERS